VPLQTHKIRRRKYFLCVPYKNLAVSFYQLRRNTVPTLTSGIMLHLNSERDTPGGVWGRVGVWRLPRRKAPPATGITIKMGKQQPFTNESGNDDGRAESDYCFEPLNMHITITWIGRNDPYGLRPQKDPPDRSHLMAKSNYIYQRDINDTALIGNRDINQV